MAVNCGILNAIIVINVALHKEMVLMLVLVCLVLCMVIGTNMYIFICAL